LSTLMLAHFYSQLKDLQLIGQSYLLSSSEINAQYLTIELTSAQDQNYLAYFSNLNGYPYGSNILRVNKYQYLHIT
ncbi:MAG: hypothetical protein KGH78_05415, partial [Candidatus Micrarchaeota archaeon]|nr:hypothetical protein [Candidatus Micrarchaeota archaeon]